MLLGQMSLYRFPYWRMTVKSLARYCDQLHIRIQPHSTQQPITHADVVSAAETLGPGDVHLFSSQMDRSHQSAWREELIRMLDGHAQAGDVVLSLDEDEVYGEGIQQDLDNFQESTAAYALFGYRRPMPTIDGSLDKCPHVYPAARHCKMFRWQPGLTFQPYRGYARCTQFADPAVPRYDARSLISHYCFFDESLRTGLRKDEYAKFEVRTTQRNLSLCAGRPRNGWVTLDADPKSGADHIAQIPPLPPAIKAQRWDMVELIHGIEHFYRWDAKALLLEVRQVLAPGGKLILEQPDIFKCAQVITGEVLIENEAQRWRLGEGGIFGDSRPHRPYMDHKYGYTPQTLRKLLVECGFQDELIVEETPRYHIPRRDFRLVASLAKASD